MSTKKARPWHCSDRLTNEYLSVYARGGNLHMLKTLKIVRSIIVNIGIIAISILAVLKGADATVIGAVGLVVLGGYNGVEVADYTALAQAIVETNQTQGENNG